MKLGETPSRDEVIGSIQALSGVEKFEWDEKNGFRCVTIKTGTDYHSLIDQIEEAGLNVGGIFIHDPERKDGQWFQYESDSNLKNWVTYPEDHRTMTPQSGKFVRVEEGFVTEFRITGRLTEALATEKRDWFEEAMKNPGVPPSPHDIVARLDGMGRVHREKWLAIHPEHQHLWDNKNSYLNPTVV